VSAAPLLDTHAWVWWVDRDRRLGRAMIDALDRLPADDRPLLSDISLWEVAMLVERGRLSFTMPLVEWLDRAAHPRTVRLIPISPAVAVELAALPASFHRNPADRVIIASCRTLGASLVTRDRLIMQSRLVSRWKPPSPDRPIAGA
jgi:PIN domain nuclease of toxin-antitoxin system